MPDELGTETGTDSAEGGGEDPTEARLAALEAQNAALIRERAFAQVLPPDVLATPVGQFFTENYQGELGMATIREQAVKLGLVADPNAGTDSAAQAGEATDDERAAFERANELRSGGTPTAHDFGPEPQVQAKEAGDQARKRGTTDDGLAAYFASMVSSAASGDPRARITTAEEYFGRRQSAGV